MTVLGGARATISVGSTAVVIILVVLFLGLKSCQLGSRFSAEIEELEPRISRVQGLIEFNEELRVAESDMGALLSQIAYDDSLDIAGTGTSLQQTVRQVFADAGLDVSGSQILPVRSQERIEVLQLDVSASGPLSAFELAIAGLRDLRPVVRVQTVNIKPFTVRNNRSAGRGQQAVVCRVRLFTARVRSS